MVGAQRGQVPTAWLIRAGRRGEREKLALEIEPSTAESYERVIRLCQVPVPVLQAGSGSCVTHRDSTPGQHNCQVPVPVLQAG